MAANAHHIRKLEVRSILKHVIQVILLAGVDDGVDEVDVEFKGLLIEEGSAESSGIDTTASQRFSTFPYNYLSVPKLL